MTWGGDVMTYLSILPSIDMLVVIMTIPSLQLQDAEEQTVYHVGLIKDCIQRKVVPRIVFT